MAKTTTQLKTDIRAKINTNGVQAITGQILGDELVDMVETLEDTNSELASLDQEMNRSINLFDKTKIRRGGYYSWYSNSEHWNTNNNFCSSDFIPFDSSKKLYLPYEIDQTAVVFYNAEQEAIAGETYTGEYLTTNLPNCAYVKVPISIADIDSMMFTYQVQPPYYVPYYTLKSIMVN